MEFLRNIGVGKHIYKKLIEKFDEIILRHQSISAFKIGSMLKIFAFTKKKHCNKTKITKNQNLLFKIFTDLFSSLIISVDWEPVVSY